MQMLCFMLLLIVLLQSCFPVFDDFSLFLHKINVWEHYLTHIVTYA
jgi:hypothetical protein